jgi:hypothetical protein
MKAILEIPERDISFNFENLTIDEFRMIGERPTELNYMVEKYPIGAPITLITSNMPPALKKEIDAMIGHYCNH